MGFPTHPLNPDTDGDGLPDGWELAHGLDPNDDGSINPQNGAVGYFQGGTQTNGSAYSQGVTGNSGATLADHDGDGLDNEIDADLDEAGIRYLRKTEMPIASNKAKTLLKLSAPKYYVLEAERGIERDHEAMGVPLNDEGKPDWKNFQLKVVRPHTVPLDENGKRAYGNTLPELREPWIFRKDSWNGNALFADSRLPTTALYCTEQLKSLAEEKGWRNIQFKEIGYMK